MEFYPRSLAECIRESRARGCGLELPMLLRIATGIAAGMSYLHGLSTPIIHRDLKPANVMLDAAGAPRICDFGISRTVAEADVTMTKSVRSAFTSRV